MSNWQGISSTEGITKGLLSDKLDTEPERPAIADTRREKCTIMWDPFAVQITLSVEGRVSRDPPTLFPTKRSHCCGELLSLSFLEGGCKSVHIRAISSGRFSSKATPHFSSSPRDPGTAWQCSLYQMPWQPRSPSLHQFGDPKLPFLVDWNPRSEVNHWLDSTETT